MNRDTLVNKGMGSDLKNWGSISGTDTDFPTGHWLRPAWKQPNKGAIRISGREEGYAENLLTNSSLTVRCPISPLFKFAVNWGPRCLF